MTTLIWTLLFLSTPLLADPVVCIHGFLRNSKCMNPLAKELKEMGHTPYLFDYPSRKRTIEGHAQELIRFLDTLDETPHFVTHSLGGIIVRAALNHPDCPDKAKGGQIIMMAPPNRGSKTAHFCDHLVPLRAFFGKKAGRQLLHLDGDAVEALGPLPECTIIAGLSDWKVSIAETIPQTPHKHYIVKSGHCFIMRKQESIAIIKSVLGKKKY